MKVADFFCGAGGFSEGFRQRGFNVVFALDNWKPAVDTHQLNHPDCEHKLMDILQLDTFEKIDAAVPDVDVIVGSPPCVVFSGSNRAGKADKSLGIMLINAYLRIIARKKQKGHLKYWVLENVPNSRHYIKDKYTWAELGLPGDGIALVVKQRLLLNAADFGAPQSRSRFFCGDFPLPEKTKKDKTSWTPLVRVLDALSDPLRPGKAKTITDPCYAITIKKSNLIDHFYDSRVSDFEWQRAKRMKDDHGYMGKMSFPEDLNRPSRTILATRSASRRESMIFQVHDAAGNHRGYRLPTIREVASIMSFPITYQFEAGNESAKYRLVGNAVCPAVSAAIAKSILMAAGQKPPRKLIQQFGIKPILNLNGTVRVAKKPKPRKIDAKFADHIPYLKIKSFRVELNNKESRFKKGEITWSAILHHGAGKDARRCKVHQQIIRRLLNNVVGFDKFVKDVATMFNSESMNAQKLQAEYVLNGQSKGMNPEKALLTMKKLVDVRFPEKNFSGDLVRNERSAVRIRRDFIPVRILAGLYACNHFVNTLK
jgi:DNA (cytosine-5)-methyltransferase 1